MSSSWPIKLSCLCFLLLLVCANNGVGKVVFGSQFPLFQKNYWYEYSSPPSTTVPEYIDYHLSPESTTTSIPANFPSIVAAGSSPGNVTTQLGSPVSLHCVVNNLQDKTVSWLQRTSGKGSGVPVLLTFGLSVYVSEARFSIRRIGNDWILDILHSKPDDAGVYECQVSTEPPQIHKIQLSVEVPVLTVMDGFGRELLDQFYKVGSSLEVMCQVDRLPARTLPEIIEWRQGTRKLEKVNSHTGQSVKTDLVGDGAISRLSIAQANVQHSGVYTCSVSDSISQSLRVHIIDESKPVPIINSSGASSIKAKTSGGGGFPLSGKNPTLMATIISSLLTFSLIHLAT